MKHSFLCFSLLGPSKMIDVRSMSFLIVFKHILFLFQTLLNLLSENCPLTVLQYDKVIAYLTSKRELQVRIELGETDTSTAPPIVTRGL